MEKTLIIIPTYNEADNIEKVIQKIIKRNIPNLFILIVDDNSPDGTGDIVDKITRRDVRVKLLRRKDKMGLGTAYVEGFKFALENQYDYIFEMDADLSHYPGEIPKFLEKIRTITGMPIQDCTSGYKCFRRQVLEKIDLNKISSDGYSFQIEMNYKAWKNNFRICEIPIVFVDRKKGDSKMTRRVMWEAAWIVWKLRFMSLIRRLK